MRIAFIVNTFPTLSETFILNQITGLLDQGHEVDIYSQRRPQPGPVHGQVSQYGLIQKTFYLDLSANRRKRLLQKGGMALRHPGRIAAALNEGNPVPGSALSSLYYRDVLEGNAKDEYDIVHCHFGNVAREFLFTRDLWKAKLVVSFHGYDFSVWPQSYGSKLYTRLFEQADAVTVISEQARSILLGLGCPPQLLVKHYMGVDLDAFCSARREKSTGGAANILSVARLVEKKGMEFAIRAVAQVVSNNSAQVHYRIVGEGPLSEELQQLAADLDLSDHVEFLGPLDHSQVQDLMGQSDIFLLPSVTGGNGDMEGMPVSLMEAMATGLPVIATEHSGIPELVIDGESGFLVPERDAGALAERIQYLAEHPERWPRMGEAGRRHAESHLDINELNRRLVTLYKHLLVGGAAAEFEERCERPELVRRLDG